MKTQTRLCSLLSLLGALVFSPDAGAHGIWFAQRGGELAMIYGDGGKDDPIVGKFDRVRHFTAYDAGGRPVPGSLIKTDHLLLVERTANPAVVAGLLDNGYYTQGSDGKWQAKSKSEVANAGKSGHYIKLAIHQTRDLAAPLNALPDHPLQILPVRPTLPRQKGAPITLRVLFNGKPLAGAKVTPDFANDPDGIAVTTDRHGKVRLKVANHGLNVIYAKHEVPTVGEDADLVQYAASFSFLLMPKAD